MSLPDSIPNPLTVRALLDLQHQGRCRPVIAAMGVEQLDELADRLHNMVSELHHARMMDPVLDDLLSLAVTVRWTLRHKRARAELDALLSWAPR